MASTPSGSGSFREPDATAPDLTPSAPGGEWDDSHSRPVDEVRDLFVTLSKALRAVQLYDENNPVYQRFVQSLKQALTRLWSDVEQIVVKVDEESLSLGGEEVYRAESRSDSLAFLFFKDGIREITFLPGIEEGELASFLDVIQRARKARGEGDDLLTILWEADLQRFKYQYVDLLAEGVELPEAGTGSTEQQLQGVLQEEVGKEEATPEEEASGEKAAPQRPAGAVNRDDFNPTLYSLDPREMETLRREVALEMARDLRGDVLAALLDRLEEPTDPERQSEILAVLRTLLPNFLSRGAIPTAARVLQELGKMEAREGVFDDLRRQESQKILERLSSPETMGELVQALEDGTIRPDPVELSMLLSHLKPVALGPLLRASEVTPNRELQRVLREAVHGIAERNPAAVATLLAAEDAVILAGAARLAGRLKTPDAGPTLAKLMGHAIADVRLAAVDAAVELRASTAAGALQPLLSDPERKVRIAAARGLGHLRYRPAAARFRDFVTGKEIRSADISEKIAFFESYGELAGDDALELLDKLLNGKGFLGRKESSEIRACAALALGRVGTDAARRALQAASLEKGAGEGAYEAFVDRLSGTPVKHIDVRPEKDVHQPELEQEEAMAAAKRTYAQSVKVAKDVLGDMRMGRAVNARKVKRAVQNIVDQVLSNEPSIVTMSTLRDFDEYTFTHCVNVCIFSVVIGQRLGLDKLQLYDLGLGALLHDIGKMRIDNAIINKPGGLTDEEWAQLKEHPTEGLLILFQMTGFADVPYRQMLLAYEHHMKVDVTGYPANTRPRNPTLFSRIVAVADGFDAGTSIRSYQYSPWPPDEVLKEMRDNPRRGFDPLLVKALITATGVFPIGTLVILDSYELAVVCGVHHEPELLHLPIVKIISDALGAPLPTPRTIDLSEIDESTGEPVRQILKTTDPQKYGIRVSDYLI